MSFALDSRFLTSGSGSGDVRLAGELPKELRDVKLGGSSAGAASGGGKKDAKAEAAALKEKKREEAIRRKEAARAKFGTAGTKIKMHEATAEEDTTPPGEKKDMSVPMRDAYEPKLVEAAWDSWWEKSGFFKPDVEAARKAGPDGKFVMVLPPPNVTGSLHLGHTLMTAIEDALARWHRMHGRPVEWLPGVDHAGIATQVVVEKRLAKERGLTRHDLGREAFLEEVWKWKAKYGGRICDQMRRLGVSVDWSRMEFTMSDRLSLAVTEAFMRMHRKGLIYRDVRLVNWSCTLQSAISEIEVDRIELEKRTMMHVPGHDPKRKYEFGVLTEFAYKIARSDGSGPEEEEELVVATTRLETMLGDTAVAVHPDDPRYKHLHKSRVWHPFRQVAIPIVTDAELVDMEFGTGAVKITPAHDPNDFACGRRHGLEEISILDDVGRINEVGGEEFAGLMRYDARVAVEKSLEKRGLLRGKKDNKMAIGICSRSGDIIEPRLKPQWWVDCKDMARRSVEAVEKGDLKILPELHKRTWFAWLRNIRDWCISRQLWWGHRIPAYYATIEGEEEAGAASPGAAAGGGGAGEKSAGKMGTVYEEQTRWFVAPTKEEATKQAAEKLGVDASRIRLTQDEDVLDTWFSSGLFPFSTFGWPDESHPDFKAFYPNSVLETGHDILFFWVARMVMMGLELTDKLPFHTVFLHSLVRDRQGRKMSKSLGNVIDPIEVITGCPLEKLHSKLDDTNLPAGEIKRAKAGQKKEFPAGIPECGADALRFGLLSAAVQGADINLDVGKVVTYRHFCNKLWNATRFAMLYLTGHPEDTNLPFSKLVSDLEAAKRAGQLASRDSWILGRLHDTVAFVDKEMEGYNFGPASDRAHRFWLQELCGTYLELTKPVFRAVGSGADGGAAPSEAEKQAASLARKTLLCCLDQGLRILHPLMPFVTEELWQRLPNRGSGWSDAIAEPPSIMVAPFPEAVPGFADSSDASDLVAGGGGEGVGGGRTAYNAMWQDVAATLINGARIIRSDSNVKPSIALTVYFQPKSELGVQAVRAFAGDMATLINANEPVILDADAPAPSGCSSATAGAHAILYVLLKGVVDVAAEVARLEKKKVKTAKNLESMEKRIKKPTYAAKVPEHVKATDQENIANLKAELEAIDASVKRIKALE